LSGSITFGAEFSRSSVTASYIIAKAKTGDTGSAVSSEPTQPVYVVATTEDGSGADWSNSSGSFRIYENGRSVLPSLVTYSVIDYGGNNAEIGVNTGDYNGNISVDATLDGKIEFGAK